ncbi:MAG: monofunctional biosynthetic peptidoglycan transglycosylase [Deltaproteobacteria bacterium]
MRRKKYLYISLAVLFLLALLFIVTMPDVGRLKKENPKKTAMMEYREAEWASKGVKRKPYQIWVPYSAISPYMVKAVLIAEDDNFWSHEGFDYQAMEKAMEKNIKARKFKAGGSTISQQLAKNLYLSPSKNPIRKLREAVLTWRLESELSKKRILEIYLNVAEWGNGVFGIEAAARHHFGKSASGLTAMEAARLAAVLPNPRRLNASGDQRYVNSRSEVIYNIMVRRGVVVEEFEEMGADGLSVEGEGVPVISEGAPVDNPTVQPAEPANGASSDSSAVNGPASSQPATQAGE